MVKIHEYQTQDNTYNSQDRVIEYSSWENYIKDIQDIDGTNKELAYASIPRQTKINVNNITDNIIEFNFIHRVVRNKINCYSVLIKERSIN